MCRTHAKVYNLHMCIPSASYQPPSVFEAWIRARAYRHVVDCSTFADFWHLIPLFRCRLLARGYQVSFIGDYVTHVGYGLRIAVLDKARLHQPMNPIREVRSCLKVTRDPMTHKVWVSCVMHDSWADLLGHMHDSSQWERFVLCWCDGKCLGYSWHCHVLV